MKRENKKSLKNSKIKEIKELLREKGKSKRKER